MLADGRLLGVLHVGSMTGRAFDDHDVDLLERVAERAGLAIAAERSSAEHAAAAALQRSLVPGRLPDIPGLELAARYLPGEQGTVGGDWYDVFPLVTGEVAFAMGDVVGRGFEAAIVMGRLRSALRAYALDSLDPAEVLRRLDRKVQHFETGQMTTIVYGVLSRTLDSIDLAIAGHLRPVLVRPDGSRETVGAHVDPPLGLVPGVPRRTSTVPLPPGALLVAFTDGLVERRDAVIDEGLARLEASLVPGSAQQSCASAIAALLGESWPADDVALLALRRRDATEPLHLRLPAVARSLATVRFALRRWLPLVGVGEGDEIDVVLAVGEVAANVVEHAYGPAGGDVTLDGVVDAGHVVVTVRDTGRWRESRGTNRGRGLGIIEQVASEVAVDRTEHGTTVRLTFEVGAGG
jgi:serine phosphatase RsbU (regulator of sigma subunit)/anti-sigma regulatory factor (Ser/Thr protein kinase)